MKVNLARRRRLIHVLEEHFTGMPSAAVDRARATRRTIYVPCKSETMENEIDYKALVDLIDYMSEEGRSIFLLLLLLKARLHC